MLNVCACPLQVLGPAGRGPNCTSWRRSLKARSPLNPAVAARASAPTRQCPISKTALAAMPTRIRPTAVLVAVFHSVFSPS